MLIPCPLVIKPTISSPLTGIQHLAILTIIFGVPSTNISLL